MESSEKRAAAWLAIIAELLQRPVTTFPHATIALELFASFDVVAVSWDWRDDDGSVGFEIFPLDEVWRSPELSDIWHNPELVAAHPLMRWFAATGDPAPQTMDRVPAAIASLRDHAVIEELLESMGCEQQLSIPYRMAGTEYREFLLARSARDFTEDDLELSRLLQPMFRALDLQARLLADLPPQPEPQPQLDLAGLTGRELAVLRLLAEGHTAFSIARRLSCSPRTVHKHLEHVYRKLDVADRLTAIRAAQQLEILSGSTSPGFHSHDVTRPMPSIRLDQVV
jgi:DNA-binding CsgD family transcriptional regulator